MIIENIRQAIRHEPFEPFSIKLKSGKVLNIRRRGYLAIGWGFIIRTSPKHNRALFINEDEIDSVHTEAVSTLAE